MGKLIQQQTALLVRQKPAEKRLPVKAPEKIRWHLYSTQSLVRYDEGLPLNQGTLPSDRPDEGRDRRAYLEKEALRWYLSRKRTLEAAGLTDSWAAFTFKFVERFTDKERRRDYERMEALEYESSVRDCLARFNKLNSRVGIAGEALSAK